MSSQEQPTLAQKVALLARQNHHQPMTRRVLLGALLAALTSLCGCGRLQTPPPLTKAELEADLAERLKLRDVALTDQGGGQFTGTGKDAEGDLVELDVVQEERWLSWKTRHKNPDGSTISEGRGHASR
jgi:hypothetical protein